MIIIVDSDGLIGSLNPTDVHYSTSNKILSKLADVNARLLYPATTIAESVTFLQGRLNMPNLAGGIIKMIREDKIHIAPVDSDLLKNACSIMNLKSSKHNTLFDCIVVAIAEKYEADAIFSFDKFYKSKGFKLASEL